MRPERFLILTADDFGLHEAVNEAIEHASRAGTLQAASLMMGAPATADAVRRARELQGLRVGLHLVLTDGTPLLPAADIPALVDAHGRFRDRLFLDGVRYFLLPRARAQLEREIRAQFRAFEATGLPLDHVNAHKHFHIHPSILGLILRVGQDFGMHAVRLPYEPSSTLGLSRAALADRVHWLCIWPWLKLMKSRLNAAGLLTCDQLLGIHHSGAMNETLLLAMLRRLPPGVTEIHMHPATESGMSISVSAGEYHHRDEYEALRSARVRAALTHLSHGRGGYLDLLRLRRQRYAA
jgi:chitin disaccharide deacetylase